MRNKNWKKIFGWDLVLLISSKALKGVVFFNDREDKYEPARGDTYISDVPILGLRPRTARTEGFLGGPRPYKDRSSKTERPAVFFGLQICQFLGFFG